MLLRLIIILAVYPISVESFSQILSFDKTYAAPTNSYSVKMVHCSDHGYATISRISFGTDWFYFQKTDSNGVLLWARIIQDASFQKVDPQQIIETTNNGFCITAALYILPNNPLSQGTAIIKLDSAGNLLWQKSIFIANYRQDGKGIAEDSAGALYICFQNYLLTQGSPPVKILVIKLTAFGQHIWTRETGITSYLIQDIEFTSASRLALCGYHRNINETKVIVLDTAGNHLFSHRFTANDTLSSTTQDWIVWPNGMPYALLNSKGSGVVYYRFNSAGMLLSGTEINYSTPITAVALHKDTANPIGLLYESSTGKAILADMNTPWANAHETGGTVHYKPADLFRNPNGSIIIWGSAPNTVSVPQHPRLIKTNPSSVTVPLSGCTVTPISLTTGIATIADTAETTSLLNTTTVFSLLNLTSTPLTVNTTVNCTITDLPDPNSVNKNGPIVYPNPANDKISFLFTSAEAYQFELFDITGKYVLSRRIDQSTEIMISSLPDGIYIYEIRTDDFSQKGKLVIRH